MNAIHVDFDVGTRRFKMVCAFHLADAMRGFPSRRFNPKDKSWRMPLVKANIHHLQNTKHIYDYRVSDAAASAIKDFEKLTAGPTYQPFPYHLYDFKRSKTAYFPMDHQRRMLDKSWNLPAVAWFAKMGTGKTFAAIHLACARFEAGMIDAVIVVCPTTLRATWRKELEKYATVDYDYRAHETKSRTLQEFYADHSRSKMQVLAVSVEGLGMSQALYDSVCGFFPHRRVMLICDESSRIKNPDAKRTQRTLGFRDASAYRVILNGTPIALGIQDLWSQFELLDPNIIGSGDYWSYKCRYLMMGGFENKQIVGVQNIEELMRAIEPYTVEVGKDVLELPPKLMTIRYVNATVKQKTLLREIKLGHGVTDIKIENVLERVLRWRQVVGGWLPRLVGDETVLEPLEENPKMDLLLDIIADNFVGSKFIIWSTFVHEIEFIAQKLTQVYGASSVEKYYGKTEVSKRSGIEDRYCNDPGLRFFVGNPATAGLGLTLVSDAADVLIYYSGTNAYIDRAQSEDRAHRIGQSSSVAVIDIVMEKTVDELIMASIGEKMDVERYIMKRLAAGENMEVTG